MLKALASKRTIDKDLRTSEFYSYIEDILKNEEVQKMNNFTHHYGTTCLQHSINVSYYNYLLAKFFHLDSKSLARAGLLHDMYLYNRKLYIRKKGERLHGSRHPLIAYSNANKFFKLNTCEREIILKHMWPLTLAFPRHKETFVIILVDKACCLAEISCYIGNVIRKKTSKATKKILAII